jgi:ankyrin repeat protein
VELLLNCQGIKIAGITNSNYSMDYVFTPLHLAAVGGHLKVVKLLLETVKQVGDLDFEEFLNFKDGIENFRRTALHYACRNGNTEVVKELLSQEGIDKEVKDALGYTPALLAVVAEGDNEDIVKLFFEDIPDPPIPSFLTDHIHFSPPDPKENFGIEYGNLPWQIILIWPNLVDSYYIDTYCYCVLPTLVKEDFDKGWKLSNEDIYFFSATRLAVLGNNGMVLDCLLKHIVPMAKKDEKLIPSQTFYVDSTNINKMINELMHYAARIGSSEALKVLLHFKPASTKGYKLDINSKMCGTTAAFIAVQNLYRFAHVKVRLHIFHSF